MSTHIGTPLTDDLDGGDADRTVTFSLDGVFYDIDLSERNAERLRAALAPFMARGTRIDRDPVPHTRRAMNRVVLRNTRKRNKAIRDWAAANGYAVAERGRISAHIIKAYYAR